LDVKAFWEQYDLSDKEHKKWERRGEKVIERYRQEKNEDAVFNILWSNTEVQRPALFSQTPKPDIRRRYRDDNPVAKQGAKVIERVIEFVMDDGDFYSFGINSVMDYLLPGRTVAKVRYKPLMSKTRKAENVSEIPQLSPLGELVGSRYYLDDEELDPAEIQFNEDQPFIEREVEEVVDESVEITRWPWKNFRHQKAKRWEDVEWVDYISFLDREQLVKLLGPKKGNEVSLTVDASGSGNERNFAPTHAEVHEVWFKKTREVKIGLEGDRKEWGKEGGDPLRLVNFYPTARPVMPINTNDSLQPIPLFTLYQHQANELDSVTKRIAILIRSIKMVGLYAGNEKDTLRRLFEADDNQMIAVPDWNAFAQSGGVSKLIDYLPVEQAYKVLSGLIQEREGLVQQIFELTGLSDISRGVSDPRETKGAQVLKAQFGSQRNLTPKQEIERYFRDTLRIAAEVVCEHFSVDTIERMTGLQMQVPVQGPEGQQLVPVKPTLEDDLLRTYSIDIETDSTVAPDEERDKAEMANALEGVSSYLTAVFPLTQAGIPAEPLVKLLKTYLRKFRWGREMEETLEEIERNPPPPKPDPELERMKAEEAREDKRFQQEMLKSQAEFQQSQKESMLQLQLKSKELEISVLESQQDLRQDQQQHLQDLRQDREKHSQELEQLRERGKAQVEVMKAQAAAKPNNDQS
jgi:hypothetical protein